MKLRILLLIFLFAVACHPAKRPDPVDIQRLQKLVTEQQKRAQRWNELQQEALKLQNEFTVTDKQLVDVKSDAFKRSGVDEKSFNLIQINGSWEFVPAPKPAPVKPADNPQKKEHSK